MTPSEVMGSNNVTSAVVYKETLGRVRNTCLFKSLKTHNDIRFSRNYKQFMIVTHIVIELWLWLASEVWLRIVAINQTFNLIGYSKDIQYTLRMLIRVIYVETDQMETCHIEEENTHTVRYAFVKAQTHTLLRSISCNSLRKAGSGFIISSNGSEPSHFRSKSKGSVTQNRINNCYGPI